MKKEQDLYVKVTSYVKLDANVTKSYDEGNLFEKKKVVNDLFGVFSNLLSSVGAIEELYIDIAVKGQEEEVPKEEKAPKVKKTQTKKGEN